MMQNIDRLKVNTETLFLFVYDLFLIGGIFSVSLFSVYIAGSSQKLVCLFEMFILIFIEVWNRVWEKKETFWAGLCCLLFVLCYKTNPVEIAIMYVYIFCARRISFKLIAKHTYIITMTMLMLIIVASKLEIIRDVVFEEYRHSLGFRYVLYGPSLFLNAVLLDVYIKDANIKWHILLFYTICNIFLFNECHANLSCGLTFIILLFMIFYKMMHNLKNNIKWKLCVYSFAICFIISFLLVYLYSKSPEEWAVVDRFLSGRLQLSARVLSEYSIKMFGNNVSWVGNGIDSYGNIYQGSYFYIDNAYINLLIEYGIFFSVVVWSLYTMAIKYSIQRKEIMLTMIFIILAVYFIFDNLKLKLVYNTFWLIIPRLVLKQYSVCERK